MKKFVLALSFVSLFAYAGQQTPTDGGPGRLTITDDTHNPVGNATVLIGMKPGDPFPDNVLTTNAAGQADLPSDFKSELPVTVTATGYITQTYVKFTPGSQLIQLHRADGQSEIEIKGTTKSWSGIVNGDGLVDFGLVIPALSRDQMLSFDMSSVVSPQNDTISIVGQKVQIPSNLALPNQSETYIVMPISLNKPDYRYYVRNPGSYHVTGLHGRFPLTQVVNDIRNGKGVLDEINYLDMREIGALDVNASGNVAGQDIAMNQTKIDTPFTVNAPVFTSDKSVLSLALAETSSGQFYATDVKRMTSGQAMQVKSTSSATTRAVLQAMVLNPSSAPAVESSLFNANDFINVTKQVAKALSVLPRTLASTPNINQLSFVFQQAGDPSPLLMPLIDPPAVANGQITLTPPQLPNGLQAIGTYVVYSDILPTGGGNIHSEIRTRLWELWTDGFVNNMTLPQIDFPKTPNHTYRWEVLFLAKPAGQTSNVHSQSLDINSVTHVSRNILNVQ